MISLELKNINKIYPGGFQAVYDFNIDIKDGEFVVLVGPSGCGKSTILRMIAGLEEITSGDMILGGKRINDVAPANRDIAMVFQNYALYGNMTVYDNMGFSLTVRHEDSDMIHEKVIETADVVGLKEYLNRRPQQLSGGQRQRVALGRSIIKDVDIMLMDEPLSNLDAQLRTNTRREIVDLHNKLNNTIVYVTHDQVEAMTMADRIVIMNKGYVQQIGTPQEVYHNPENMFVASFIGTPPMNLIKGNIEKDVFFTGDIKLKIPTEMLAKLEDYSGKNIFIGIRPEHITINRILLDKYKDSIIDCVVTVSEFLGSDLIVHLNAAGNDVTARLKSKEHKGEFDKEIKLAVKMDEVHFFDADTGRRIK